MQRRRRLGTYQLPIFNEWFWIGCYLYLFISIFWNNWKNEKKQKNKTGPQVLMMLLCVPRTSRNSISKGAFSLGLPLRGCLLRKNSKIVCFVAILRKRYTGGFYASLRYIERTSASYGGHNKTKRGGYRYIYCLLSRYTIKTFWPKIRCRFSKLPNKGIPVDFSPVSLRYIHWTKISYWGHNKTKRGIPIYAVYWRKYDVDFDLTEFFTSYVFFFSSRAKNHGATPTYMMTTYVHRRNRRYSLW